MLANHGTAFEADLSRFHHGLQLADMYRGLVTVRHVAVLAAHLPRGESAVMRAIGGPGGITDETEAAWLVEHAVMLHAWRATTDPDNPGEPPTMRDYPTSALAARDNALAADESKTTRLERRAEAFRRKHASPKTE